MTAENTADTARPEKSSTDSAIHGLIKKVTIDHAHVSTSAICQLNAGHLDASASAFGMTTVEGDTKLTASIAPLVYGQGDTTVQQSYASAVIAGGGAFTRVRQSAAPLIVGKSMELEQVGAVALVAGDAKVKNSWVGIVVAPSAEISEDSKVLVSTRGALIIGAALLGGFGLVAIAVALGFSNAMRQRRAHAQHFPAIPAHMRSQIASHLKRLPDQLPDMHEISAAAKRVRQHIGV